MTEGVMVLTVAQEGMKHFNKTTPLIGSPVFMPKNFK